MNWLRCACCSIAVLTMSWSASAQPGTPATSVVGYPGAGVIQAGDASESFLPQCFGPNYQENGVASTRGVSHVIQLGNFDRNWTTPGTHWPAAFPLTPYWYKNVMGQVFDPDTNWNRATMVGQPNNSYYAVAAPPGAQYSNFANLTYRSTLNGANDPNRTYSIEPYFVDGARRQHVVYEAAWPTNLGIDVKVRAHAFAAPNWNNLNDFVVIELQLKNTGYMDINMNGAAEQLNHDIKAIAIQVEAQSYMSISSYGTGARAFNDLGATAISRQAGWVDDLDPAGAPWAFSMVFPSATTYNPATGSGNIDLGFNGGTTKPYTDIHHGWVMIDVKSGGLPTDRAQSTSNLSSKQTIFGTHPVGSGPERGWYATGGSSRWAGLTDDPRKMFYISTGAFYQDGGRKSHTLVFDSLNLAPNANFFSGGTPGDPLTFVPKAALNRTRPDGDFKSSGTFDQVSFENGSADSTTLYPNGWGKWTAGCSNTENFDGDMFSGVGPFSIPCDSTITIVLATVGGYRLEGIQRSVRAARWAYENNYQIPVPPPLPDLSVSVRSAPSISLDWDNAAQADPEFAGYKIWRASKRDTLNYLDEGMRVVDRYQEQMSAGPRPSSVFKPVNPKFDAFARTLGGSVQGKYQPDTWGTWKLIKVIPKADLGTVAPSGVPGYTYTWNDDAVVSGASYWYYLSAFKEGTYVGPGAEIATRIESHSTNRNGASGLWVKTFPFAPLNANYPKDAAGKKAIGAAIVSGTVSVQDEEPTLPAVYGLDQNYPNPFNPATVIAYRLPVAAVVKLAVYDMLGREVALLVNEVKAPGTYTTQFDGAGLASGTYVYRLAAGGHVESRKMLLIR